MFRKKSTRRALNAYKALDDEQQQIVKQQYIQGTHTMNEWLNMLDGVINHHVLVSRTHTRHTYPGLMVLIIGIIASVYLENIVGKLEKMFPIYVLIALGIAIYRFFRPSIHRLLQNRSLPEFRDHYLCFALPILTMLQDDIAKDQPVELWVDLREKNGAAHKIHKWNQEPIKDTTTTFYQNEVMEVRTQLVDGTRIYFKLGDITRKRVRERYNANGKYKTKTKRKVKIQWQLKLAFPKKNYRLTQQSQTTNATSSAKYLTLKVQRREDNLISYMPDAQVFVSMMQEAYSKVERG